MSCKLYTVNPFDVTCEMGPAPRITVRGRDATKRYAYTVIHDWSYKVDHGNDNWTDATDSGEKMAKGFIERNPGLGLFLAADPIPSEDELVEAETSLRGADAERLRQGDFCWDSKHNRALLSTEWIRSARRLKAAREWAEERPQEQLMPCPICTKLIPKAAKKCPNCLEWLVPQEPAAPASEAKPAARAAAAR